MNNLQKWLGVVACIGVIVSCFMPWAYYPDLGKHFTGFDTQVLYKGNMIHYYGRPGFILSFLAGFCLLFHLVPKIWAKRANLIFGALCMAFAIKSYFTFTSAYAGNVPVKNFGIYVMSFGALVNILCIIFSKAPGKRSTGSNSDASNTYK